jgi:group I intron endonuclease
MTVRSGIYEIENLVNGKVYIGQAVNLDSRKRQHFSDLRLNKHYSGHLQNAYNKYGADNFIFKPILYCEQFELTRYEQAIVDITSNIYNIRKLCIDSNKGIKYSEEVRLKNSERQKGEKSPLFGKPMSEEQKQKIGNGNRGKKRTPEQIAILSEAHMGQPGIWKGKHLSEEHKNKLSIAHAGKVMSEEAKKKLSASHSGVNHWNYGKHRSEETKRKLSEANTGKVGWMKGKHHTEESNAKNAVAHLGKPGYWQGKHLSEETRKKISDAVKKLSEAKK